jgi:hypothetical protein
MSGETRRPCVIMDLDGTLANADHRLHLLPQNGGSWRAFFEAAEADTPIHEIVMVNNLLCNELPVFIVTGRSAVDEAMTVAWLRQHGVSYDKLYMRGADDRREDWAVKREILEEIRASGFEPILAFEDRKKVVAMWREEGVRCLQVCEGDY